jgi:transcription elongation factor B subunit 1
MEPSELLRFFSSEDSRSESSTESEDEHPEEEAFREPFSPVDAITLISKEGVRFHVSKEVAKVSGLLSCLLDPEVKFAETVSGEIHLDRIRAVVLERVVDYMHFNFIWRDHSMRMPAFHIDASITVETLIAADFLRL